MANPELGAKQICPNCQAKFYDLTRRPAVCPKCGTEFDPDEAVRNRRVRARAAPVDHDHEDAEDQVRGKAKDEDEEEDDASTPELDEVANEPRWFRTMTTRRPTPRRKTSCPNSPRTNSRTRKATTCRSWKTRTRTISTTPKSKDSPAKGTTTTGKIRGATTRSNFSFRVG